MELTSFTPYVLDSYGAEVNLNLDIGHSTGLTPLSMLSQLNASSQRAISCTKTVEISSTNALVSLPQILDRITR